MREMTGPFRLRFDKVVLRLMADVRSAADHVLPAGTTALITVSAPIRLPAKTAASIVDTVTALQARGSTRTRRATVHGNDVGVRLVTHTLARAPKLLGFVHNPDPEPNRLLDAAAQWLDLLGRASRARSTASPAGVARGHVLRVPATQGSGTAAVDAYLIEQLRPATPFRSIVVAPD